ncbi:MAG: prolipoprotein diacylglyceryl transferase [Defluviitaleaceae bacterium]|nr:prolipoprotein diacylglyceryl transferase [Defluviitaleaceae bacterium]
MFPSFEILGREFHLYHILGIIALFVAAGVASLRAKKFGMDFTELLIGVIILGAGLLVGGVFVYALVQAPAAWENRHMFSQAPWLFLQRVFGGMVFYGGLFGVMAAMPLYAKFIKKDIPTILRVIVPVLPLAHAIMRVGCFFAGCCHGMPHETLGVYFPHSAVAPGDIRLIPVQLYETALNLIIFVILWMWSNKPRHHLHLVAFYGITYAIGRFSLEFLRGDAHRGQVFALSTSQFISILVVVACIILLLINKMRSKSAH